MKWLTAMALGFLAVGAQAAFAMPGLTSALSPALSDPSGPAENCASFDGTWKGVCTIGNTKVENTKVIHQTGCSSLLSGDEYQPIGGISTQALTFPVPEKGVLSISAVTATDWNKDKSALDFHVGGLLKKVGELGVIDLTGSGTQRLEGNNRMVIDFTILKMKGSCVYDRQ